MESQRFSLRLPIMGKEAEALQSFRRQFRWLLAGQNGLDDVGRQERQWQGPADVALVNVLLAGDLPNRRHLTFRDSVEPLSSARDEGDEVVIRSYEPAGSGQDDLALDTAPTEGNWQFKCYGGVFIIGEVITCANEFP